MSSAGVAASPSPAADWKVEETGDAFTLTPGSGTAVTGVRFAPATGCATFPEADLNAAGTPSKGALPYGRVGGLVDGHMHWMTFEYFGGNFHCGRPWHAYGIASALPDCASIEGPGGTAAVFQNFLNYGNPAQPHDTRGYPDLTGLERDEPDLRGHLLALDPAVVDGRAAADGHERQREPRAVLAAADQEDRRATRWRPSAAGSTTSGKLQDYVDAQAGGPGKGFFQIVTDPYEARQVINAGKMAVVLEIEVSEPFGCRERRDADVRRRRRSTASSTTSTSAACAPRCC